MKAEMKKEHARHEKIKIGKERNKELINVMAKKKKKMKLLKM